eukprot:Skav230677  [mRNA]  locus=scaffold2185:383206:385037:- [translate_table: standard]
MDSALQSDDQCDSGDAECSFNALQLRGFKEEMELEENNEEGEGWLKDITTKTKNHFKHILAPLQKPIVTNYQYLTVLDSYVNYTMQKVENATGHLVIWNRKSLLQEFEELEEPEDEDELLEAQSQYHGRRRRTTSSEELPPRARSPVLDLNNTLTMHVKGEDRKYDNKYAQQLQADYLIDNINDASKKCNDLRARLFKMNWYADKFDALPSGVWNKIDAQ